MGNSLDYHSKREEQREREKIKEFMKGELHKNQDFLSSKKKYEGAILSSSYWLNSTHRQSPYITYPTKLGGRHCRCFTDRPNFLGDLASLFRS